MFDSRTDMNSLVSGKMKMTHLGELVWLNEAGVALKLYFQYEGHDNNGLKLFAHFFELNGAKACEPAQAATPHHTCFSPHTKHTLPFWSLFKLQNVSFISPSGMSSLLLCIGTCCFDPQHKPVVSLVHNATIVCFCTPPQWIVWSVDF